MNTLSKILGKTKRAMPATLSKKEKDTPSHTEKLFRDLGLIYTRRLVFADSCKQYKNIAISDLSFYHENPANYDRSGNLYGAHIGSGYVVPGTIRPVSKEVGYGYFTRRHIPKEEMAGEYTGKIMLRDESGSGAYAWSYPKSGAFQESLPGRTSLDAAVYGNEMRFVNHSDTPNLRMEVVFHGGQWHIVFIANSDIEKGQELRVSYGQKYWRRRKKLVW